MSTIQDATRVLELSRVFAWRRDGDTRVAFGRRHEHTLDDLRRRVAGVAERVLAVGPGRWLLFSNDSYAFLAALLALAHTRSTAILPPNGQPGTLRELARDATGAILDGGSELDGLARIDALAPAEGDPAALREPDPGAPFVELFTSGTSSERKSIPKTMQHFEVEVRALEATLGSLVGSRPEVFATVTHQHLYGLLFRLLWPFAAGRPFDIDSQHHSEELLARLAGARDTVLVSSPAHLRRFASAPGLRALRGSLGLVVSSGAPLDSDTASATEAALGRPPLEIFGSTETGAVAWRRPQKNEAVPWSPLAGVRIEREPDQGRLLVRSGFVSVGEPCPDASTLRFVMGDRIDLVGADRFHLRGRVDRIVKLGEKRLSLPDMEEQLRRHPLVQEVALVPLERKTGTRLGAVVVLAPEGEARLHAGGRRAVAQELRQYLTQYWDRVLLPRAWRYLPELPSDARGKTPAEVLRGLFDAGGSAPPRSPEWLGEQRGEHRLERSLRVPDDLAYLEGHFPGTPLVAGVVQLHWALEAARDWLGRQPAVLGIDALKFSEVLPPGQAFELVLERPGGGDRLHFRLSRGERVFSSGRVRLGGQKGSE